MMPRLAQADLYVESISRHLLKSCSASLFFPWLMNSTPRKFQASGDFGSIRNASLTSDMASVLFFCAEK